MPDEAVPDQVHDEMDERVVLPGHMVVGCADLPPGLRRARYFQRLGYLEIGGTRYQMPKARVLARWREETGDLGRIGLVAPQTITDRPGPKGYPRAGAAAYTRDELAQAGSFRDTPFVRRCVTELADACATLGAHTAVFRSPPDFTPSARNRDQLRAFFGELASAERFAATARVWQPGGLWDLGTAAHLAAELGVVLACDPLSNDPLLAMELDFSRLPVPELYMRITGLGRGETRYDEYALEPLLDLIPAYQRVWVVFAHAHRYPDAIRCQRLLAAAQLDEPGG